VILAERFIDINVETVSCLREANQILFLDGQGNIATFSNVDGLLQHECFQELSDEQATSYNSSDGEKSDAVQPALTAPAYDHIPLPESENGYSESDILKGDMTLYPFYLKSIGKFACILWALVMLLLAVTERLSGRCIWFDHFLVMHQNVAEDNYRDIRAYLAGC
jgi:hypothetical protein